MSDCVLPSPIGEVGGDRTCVLLESGFAKALVDGGSGELLPPAYAEKRPSAAVCWRGSAARCPNDANRQLRPQLEELSPASEVAGLAELALLHCLLAGMALVVLRF